MIQSLHLDKAAGQPWAVSLTYATYEENKEVTEQDLEEFKLWYAEKVLYEYVWTQLTALREGFYEVAPYVVLRRFQVHYFDRLIAGENTISLTDWHDSTIYENGYTCDSDTVKLFWKIVTAYNNEERFELFTTITSLKNPPFGGFSELNPNLFTIFKLVDTTRLPVAHTCICRLDLPDYNDEQKIQNGLLYLRSAREML